MQCWAFSDFDLSYLSRTIAAHRTASSVFEQIDDNYQDKLVTRRGKQAVNHTKTRAFSEGKQHCFPRKNAKHI